MEGKMKLKERFLNKKFIILAICGVIIFAVGIVVGAQTTNEVGSVNDPLITKSYLDMRLGENGDGGSGSSYKKVTLSKGKILVGHEGTEIMLYQGNASAYSSAKGIVNVTVGEMSANSTTLGKYCIYVTPDSDSGVKAESDLVLFVKGSYSTN